MKLIKKLLLFSLVILIFSCEKEPDSGVIEGGLLDGLIRVEALLKIRDAEFLQIHPQVQDKTITDDVYIAFDSRDGTMTVGQNSQLSVAIDYTGLGGAYHLGSMEMQLKKSGNQHIIDFQASETEETSTVVKEYAFKVENLPQTSDEVLTDVSTWRYLEFELNGKEVCNYLKASNIPNSSINPIYIWDSSLSFRNELTKCDCEGESELRITLVYDAS